MGKLAKFIFYHTHREQEVEPEEQQEEPDEEPSEEETEP